MILTNISDIQEYLNIQDIGGWLVYDYRQVNPIFYELIGAIENVTRPCWLWVPVKGKPKLLVSLVDRGRFTHLSIDTLVFTGRQDMISKLQGLVGFGTKIAMEYSQYGELPRTAFVDAGTVELVRSIGGQIVSSADTLQFATQRWNEEHLKSHVLAAKKLTSLVQEAFIYVGKNINKNVTELQVAEFIRQRFIEEGLEVTDGPVVAVNEHSSDPHFNPTMESSHIIKHGDWLLIDVWGRIDKADSMFADITWTAFVGDQVPEYHQMVFDSVIRARDRAVTELKQSIGDGKPLCGWEVDKIARDVISEAGFLEYFNHRLGHSLGREVHGNAVNLDSLETHDTRQVIPGLAVTIEPGVYLPEFGVRSEIDVYIDDHDIQITTPPQNNVFLIKS